MFWWFALRASRGAWGMRGRFPMKVHMCSVNSSQVADTQTGVPTGPIEAKAETEAEAEAETQAEAEAEAEDKHTHAASTPLVRFKQQFRATETTETKRKSLPNTLKPMAAQGPPRFHFRTARAPRPVSPLFHGRAVKLGGGGGSVVLRHWEGASKQCARAPMKRPAAGPPRRWRACTSAPQRRRRSAQLD